MKPQRSVAHRIVLALCWWMVALILFILLLVFMGHKAKADELPPYVKTYDWTTGHGRACTVVITGATGNYTRAVLDCDWPREFPKVSLQDDCNYEVCFGDICEVTAMTCVDLDGIPLDWSEIVESIAE